MKERLGVLDGLRGIAILQVLWFHLWVLRGISEPVPWLQFLPKTGNFGVHLFFFLSGFVIVFPFVRAQRANQPEPQWTHFAWRRFIKIVPSYALSIAIAYAVGFAAVERSHATILAELVTHALFIHTWWPSTATSINGVLWTLAIEAEFYAIFPLLWWLFKRRPWATGLALIALSWALRMWRATFLAPAVVNALSGNLPNFVDLFAFGMLCAWCVAHFGETARAPEQRFRMSALAAVGTAVIIGTFIGIGNGRAFYPNVYLHEVLGAGFALLAFGALASPRWNAVLSNRVLLFFALISYNLYLYNWMIMHEMKPASDVAFAVVTVGASILVASLVTFLLERPLLRLPDPLPAAKAKDCAASA